VYLYAAATRSRNRTGWIAFWALVVFLVGIYIANMLGPPPPSARAIGVAGLAMWLLIPWAVWIDRNREPAPEPGRGAATPSS
jgi:hypothetical protein